MYRDNADTSRSTGPFVSVIIPCFNHALCVARAVRSALQSTHRNIEVVVFDDGSTDDPIGALAELTGDARLKTLRHNHVGSNVARRLAIEASRGDYVTFLDADDVMDPARIEAQLVLAVRGGPRSLVFCGSKVFHRGRLAATKIPTGVSSEAEITGEFSRMAFRPNSVTLLIARAFYDELGGFDPAYRHIEMHLHLRALKAGARIFAVPATLYHVHRDGRSLSTRVHGEDMARFIAEVDRIHGMHGANDDLREYARMRQRFNALHLLSSDGADRAIILRALRKARIGLFDRAGIEITAAFAPLLRRIVPSLITTLRSLMGHPKVGTTDADAGVDVDGGAGADADADPYQDHASERSLRQQS